MGEIGELVVADERIKNCAVPAHTGNFVCATRGCSFLRLNFFSIQIPEIETFLAAMACGCVCARMARAEISGRVSIARRVELVRANRTRTGWKVCGRRALRGEIFCAKHRDAVDRTMLGFFSFEPTGCGGKCGRSSGCASCAGQTGNRGEKKRRPRGSNWPDGRCVLLPFAMSGCGEFRMVR